MCIAALPLAVLPLLCWLALPPATAASLPRKCPEARNNNWSGAPGACNVLAPFRLLLHAAISAGRRCPEACKTYWAGLPDACDELVSTMLGGEARKDANGNTISMR